MAGTIINSETGESFYSNMTRGDLKSAGLIYGYGQVAKNNWTLEVDAETYRRLAPATQPKAQQETTPRRWQDEPAAERQRAYLVSLGVQLEPGLTKGRASELIDAAKNGELGSVNGFYHSGSN